MTNGFKKKCCCFLGMSCGDPLHDYLSIQMCQTCKNKFSFYYQSRCWSCDRFWSHCSACRTNVISCGFNVMHMPVLFDRFCQIKSECISIDKRIKNDVVETNQAKSMPLMVLFFSLIAKKYKLKNYTSIFPKGVLALTMSFLTSDDKEKCRKLCFEPILHGQQPYPTFSVCQDFYFVPIAEYFQQQYQKYAEQLRQLLSLNKQYLFELFCSTHFHERLPKLVNFPNTERKLIQQANCLGVEFCSSMGTHYKQKLVKMFGQPKASEFQTLFFTYRELFNKLELHERVKRYKTEANRTPLETQRFVTTVKKEQGQKMDLEVEQLRTQCAAVQENQKWKEIEEQRKLTKQQKQRKYAALGEMIKKKKREKKIGKMPAKKASVKKGSLKKGSVKKGSVKKSASKKSAHKQHVDADGNLTWIGMILLTQEKNPELSFKEAMVKAKSHWKKYKKTLNKQ